MKRLQNRISESRSLLPVMAAYGVVVWMAYGLLKDGLWPQFLLFAMTAYLMVELNNRYALIRIFSRMVSAAYIMLSCASCFLFASVADGAVGLCMVAGFVAFFHTYQDPDATGWTYHTFLFMAVASLFDVGSLLLVPIVWLLMATSLMSMSPKTFAASLLGVLTPYWFWALGCFYFHDFSPLAAHVEDLWHFGPVADFYAVDLGRIMTLALVAVLAIVGIVHYMLSRINDKIRVRNMHDCFILTAMVTLLIIILQPQRFDLLLRVLIISTSPLIAHFVALTRTRLTNAAFILIAAGALALTAYNLMA